jgi:uncharacterized protein (DUF362 family)
MTVSVVRYDSSGDSLRRAIELCDGLEGLRQSDRVLIKPNYGFRHKAMPPYGTVTTSTVLDSIIRLLREHGCADISIGEGAITGILSELDLHWKRGFKGTGVDRVAGRHGVRLVDFNEGPFEELDLGGVRVQVARDALETDFLINVPVLKTHSQLKASLGFKNLKGCLSQTSKKKFHSTNRLDALTCLLNEAIKSNLVIVDGIYMLERGPDTLVGTAHRKDLIIAGKDVFECDAVGAAVLGIDPTQLEYLVEFAGRHDRSLDLSSIQIEGEDIETLKENLAWEPDIGEDLFSPQRIEGLFMPHPGKALCSGCYATLTCTLLLLSKENPTLDFSDASVCIGPELRPERERKTVFLCGNCAVKANRDLPNAVRIEGCPPSLVTSLLAFMRPLLSKPQMLRTTSVLVAKLAGMRLGVRTETFPRWERYRSKEFDSSDF